EKSELNIVGTCSEQGAAFAADAYSRLNGMGALAVTYCVGGLNTLNAVAGAYAEKIPLIVISGAPGLNERDGDYLLHHSIQDMDTQYKIFQNVTVASTKLEDPTTAVFEIDRVFDACNKHKRPVYIELPRDMIYKECLMPPKPFLKEEKSKEDVLEEVLNESIQLIKKAKKPVILAGEEIRRYQLENIFLELLENSKYPYSTTFLGKAIIDESHPQFLGVYMAKLGREKIRKYIEEADCIIMIGTLMTDMNYQTAQLDITKTIYATSDRICIKHHYYKDILLEDFMKGLAERLKNDNEKVIYNDNHKNQYIPIKDEKLKASRFFQRLDSFLKEGSTVICDVGDCLFGTADLKIPKNSVYLGPVYYTSMGYAIPGAIGAQTINPDSKTIVIVGDGAFQMTGHEISCYAKYGMKPIIFVVNNHGYTTQRFIQDGSFNEIYNWEYQKWPEILGYGLGLEVRTEDELEEALIKAENNKDSFTIINLHFDKYDKSNTLARLTSYFSKIISQSSCNQS
ncbi:MAG: thiamine pyrophosphate-dependent enzyme, partial [Candidatus Gastranaerophilaceae bacterium]